MDVFEAIKIRRSTRAFTSEKIPDREVEKLLEAARLAPSAGNLQPWEFVVIRKAETKKRLAEAALDQHFIDEASVVIGVCADEKRCELGYGSRGVSLYCIQDTAAAIENILLVAVSLGLGACWVGAFREHEVRQILNIPRGLRPVAIIPVGRPAERPHPRSKRTLREIVHYETF